MPLFSKPQFNNVWASTGVKLAPDSAKISQGWIVEIPPHEYENWVQGRQDQLLAHVNQVGIPMWDATVEYQAGKSYIQGTTTGTVYRAVTTNTNVNPELDIQGNWVVAFQASGEALLKSQNLADVPDKALARQNLGIATTEFYDGRYLTKVNNLVDVPNKATARANLGLGNSSTRNVGTTSGTVAEGNDSRIVNAVPRTLRVNAGAGMNGGGALVGDITIDMATPSTVTNTSTNYVVGGSHGHALDTTSFLPSSWNYYTSSRQFGVTYTNTSGKFIIVSVLVADPGEGNLLAHMTVSGVVISKIYAGRSAEATLTGWVPPGSTYRVDRFDGNDVISSWAECR